MSLINITNVIIQPEQAKFTDGYTIEISFEALESLQNPLIWKVIYVGEATNDQHDQVLEDIEMNIENAGTMRFTIEAGAPDPSKIPGQEIIGVTAVLLTCSYNTQEFFRVGYYVNVTTIEEEPATLNVDSLVRTVMVNEPRVTNFPIEWDSPMTAQQIAESGFVAPANSGEVGFGTSANAVEESRKDLMSKENLQIAENAFRQQM